jgi:hypothetical protein
LTRTDAGRKPLKRRFFYYSLNGFETTQAASALGKLERAKGFEPSTPTLAILLLNPTYCNHYNIFTF